MDDRVVIDLRRRTQEAYKELSAELIIEIDLFEEGYGCFYERQIEEHKFEMVGSAEGLTREQMVERHVQEIQRWKPKTVVIRTGVHSTGHIKDIPLHPGVIKSIIDGTLDATKLTLHD